MRADIRLGKRKGKEPPGLILVGDGKMATAEACMVMELTPSKEANTVFMGAVPPPPPWVWATVTLTAGIS